MSTEVGEVAPIRPGEELDWAALETWLRAQLPDLPAAAMQVEQFPRGRANLTYRLRFGDLYLVLRRPPFGKTAPGAHDMVREHRILSRLAPVYSRAPCAFALCEDVAVIGAPFVVQEYRGNGVVIFGEAPADMVALPDLGNRLTRAMADALCDLHQVDYIAAGFTDLGKPEGFVARQLSGWRDRWSRVVSADCAATMDSVADRLDREMPSISRHALIHNDFKLDNCQLRPGNPDVVVSVFDWDMATVGDPLIDVGITLAYWNYMRSHATLGLPPGSTFAAMYAERMGIDVAELRWYEAFAHWRSAVAVQQLYDRYARGNSQDARHEAMGRTVPILADRAQAVLEGRSI